MTYIIDLKDNERLEVTLNEGVVKIKYNNYVVFNDILSEGLGVFKRMLEEALSCKLEVSSELKDISIGLWWNDYTDSYDDEGIIEDEDLAEKYWLWSIKSIQSWLFNKRGKTYLEISRSYPWHFVEPKEGEKFISYQEFRSNFEPIAVIEISPQRAKTIIDECNRLIESIE